MIPPGICGRVSTNNLIEVTKHGNERLSTDVRRLNTQPSNCYIYSQKYNTLINDNYDVVAEAEAILADALVTA